MTPEKIKLRDNFNNNNNQNSSSKEIIKTANKNNENTSNKDVIPFNSLPFASTIDKSKR